MQKNNLYYPFIFFVFLSLYSTNRSIAQINYNATTLNTPISLEHYIEIFEDTTAQMSLEQVKNNTFSPMSAQQKLNEQHVYWGRVRFKNTTDYDQHYVFYIGAINYVDFYTFENNQLIKTEKAGRLVSSEQKEINRERSAQVLLNVKKNSTQTYYFKFWNVDARTLELKPMLYNNMDWEKQFAQRNLFLGLFHGILLLLVFYQLAAFFYTSQWSYWHLAMYMLSFSLYSLTIQSLLSETLFQSVPALNEYVMMSLFPLMGHFYLLFTMHFLRTKAQYPTWHRIFTLFLYLFIPLLTLISLSSIITTKLGWFLNYIRLYYLVLVILFTPFLTMLIVRRKNNENDLFIIANVQLTVMVLIQLFITFQNESSRLGMGTANAGVVIQNIIFTIAIARNVQILEAKRKKTQEENFRIIAEQKEVLEQTVLERTQDILERNAELKQQQEEILTQRDFIEQKNQQLNKQNDRLVSSESILRKYLEKLKESELALKKTNEELKATTHQIQSSIRSAQTIQQATLPHKAKIQKLFDDYFIIYKPKDVVSGDFYWVSQHNHKTLLIAADCTGHGVPGAFMTLIATNLLDKIIRIWQIEDPAEILTQLHQEVQTVLRQKETNNNNGMDITVLQIQPQERQSMVTFVGAKQNLFYFDSQTKTLDELKGTRKSIGGEQNEEKIFENQQIHLSKGSILYIGSDGLEDQNDYKRRRLGRDKLRKVIEELTHLPMQEQQTEIEAMLKNHMEGTEQRDDILWIGIKL
ncbi:MAG: hypothetical protein EAZ55_05770 [Cytophagales bacterium]|nr:MAG: hypothetical protein EAZ55_05770 [Cytophagales bacterium]